jgi:hypothetical protein
VSLSDADLAILAEIKGMMKWGSDEETLSGSLRATLFLAEAVVTGYRIMLEDPAEGTMHEVHLGKGE